MTIRPSTFAIGAGVCCLIGALAPPLADRHFLAAERREIALLRDSLGSTRTRLGVARTSADSTRLVEEIRSREYFIGRREFHLPVRQERLREWWQRTGPGTLGVALFVVLVTGGVVARRRS